MVQDKGKLVHATPANELTEKQFGFESVINKQKLEDATNTTFIVNSDKVPSGKIWKITRIGVLNQEGDISEVISLFLVHDDTEVRFLRKSTATAQNILVDISVEFYLDAEDYIKSTGYTVAVGEKIELNIFGYEMNAP